MGLRRVASHKARTPRIAASRSHRLEQFGYTDPILYASKIRPVVLLPLIAGPPRYAAAQVPSAQPPNEPVTGPAIKANVREVLVPAVVIDTAGHPVSGLRQSDFTVYEDDVPQRIVAFAKTYDASLEVSDTPAFRSGEGVPKLPLPYGVGPDSPTRTYLVCVDTLHSSFGNMVQARRPLTKFFHKEHDEKAQYALLNLGRQIDVRPGLNARCLVAPASARQ